MSRKYKFGNKEGLNFVSFATVYWLDVFVREKYSQLLMDRLSYGSEHKGMEIYCWCILPSQVHLIVRAKNNDPGIVLGKFKEYTSKALRKAISENATESRREWLLWMMARAAT